MVLRRFHVGLMHCNEQQDGQSGKDEGFLSCVAGAPK